MARRPDIKTGIFKNKMHRKLNTNVSDIGARKKLNNVNSFFANEPAEYQEALEDTPSGVLPSVKALNKTSVSNMKRSTSRRRRGGVFASVSGGLSLLMSGISGLFRKRKAAANASAIKFAGKRQPLKTKKNRRVIYWAGAALVLVTALIVVLSLTAQTPVVSAQSEVATLQNILPPSVYAGLGFASAPPNVSGTLTSLQPAPTVSTGATASQGAAVTQTPSSDPTTAVTAGTGPTPIPTTEPEATLTPMSLDDMTEYYMVEAEHYYNDYHYSSNRYNYTEDEVIMLARVITSESGGEKYEGQLAVGNVIMNRVLCGYWGTTIASVVTAPNQFAYNPDRVPKSSCIRAARDVLQNEHWVLPQDVFFFNSSRAAGENWGSHVFYKKIGGHCFYTERVGRRLRGGDVPPKLFDREFKWPQYGCKPAKRVSRIQHMLRGLGFQVEQDGYFGKTTKDAVIEFQRSKGIEDDGVCGPSTIKALIKAYGKDKYLADYYD